MTATATQGEHAARPAPQTSPPTIECPFTIVVDSNEYLPQHNGYRFEGPFYANADRKNARILVKTITENLPAGDYSIFGMPSIIIERKSKADLYQSITKRRNFIERLEMMEEIGRRETGGYAAVVVECNDVDLLIPPTYTKKDRNGVVRTCKVKMPPKSVSRTIMAWRMRFNVEWHFYSGRERAEANTFRLLEMYWNNRQEGK